MSLNELKEKKLSLCDGAQSQSVLREMDQVRDYFTLNFNRMTLGI